MYSVFIVDDEVIVRDGIRGKIEWGRERSQFNFAGEAADGEIALSMMQDIKPDILITDIRMPFMDGLELSQRVKKLLPWTKIIILSGHDEFDYARKAISIGVEDYILKPFTSEELLAAMNRAAEDLESEKRRFLDIEKMKRELESASAVARDRLLGDIVTGAVSASEAGEAAAAMQINLEASLYTVCVSELRFAGEANINLLLEAKSRLLSIQEAEKSAIAFFISPEQAVFILKSSTPESAEEKSYNLANAVEHELSGSPGLFVITSIGITVDSSGRIPESYFSAARYLKEARFSGKSRIINSSDYAESGVAPSDLKDDDPLIDRIRYADESETAMIVEQLLDRIEKLGEDFAVTASCLLVDVIMSISKLIEELGGNVQDVEPDLVTRQFVASAVKSREAFALEVERALKAVILWRNSRTQGRYANIILKAKRYIRENFANPDICLMTTAKSVNMSPNHFSSVFSQECGMTYIEYLTSVRIETAKKLLKNTTMRSSEIAYETGFSDPHYFSFIFKKSTGLSPLEYRDSAASSQLPATSS